MEIFAAKILEYKTNYIELIDTIKKLYKNPTGEDLEFISTYDVYSELSTFNRVLVENLTPNMHIDNLLITKLADKMASNLKFAHNYKIKLNEKLCSLGSCVEDFMKFYKLLPSGMFEDGDVELCTKMCQDAIELLESLDHYIDKYSYTFKPRGYVMFNEPIFTLLDDSIFGMTRSSELIQKILEK